MIGFGVVPGQYVLEECQDDGIWRGTRTMGSGGVPEQCMSEGCRPCSLSAGTIFRNGSGTVKCGHMYSSL